MEAIRVALVDDNPMFLDMLAGTLDQNEHLSVVAKASSVREARALVKPGEVDVAVIDIELPDGNGVGLGLGFQQADPAVKIVLLSAHSMLDVVWQLPGKIGEKWSYLSKTSTASIDDLTHTIVDAAHGRVVVDPALLPRPTRGGTGLARLTNRQRQILALVSEGYNNEAIADRLGLAEKSVVNHLTAIYQHLNIEEGKNSRVAATLVYLSDSDDADN
jgi:DNA-binding NarL/FixJ family response regulator